MTAGVRLGHTADIKTLLDDFAAFQPTFILAVPRVFEKVYNSAEAEGRGRRQGQDLRRRRGRRHRLVARRRSRRASRSACKVRHAVFDRLVYGKLRAALGGKVQYAVSGGAPLGTRLGHFYRGIGVTILEGYGLTETTAPATVNLPGAIKIGTRRPAAARRRRAHRRRRRDPAPRRQRLPRLLGQRRGHRRGGRATAGSTPATSASSTTTASCGSPAARRRSWSPPAARTSPRRCSRTGCAPTRWSASASSSATASRSSPRWSPSTRRCTPAGPATTGSTACSFAAARTDERVIAEVQKAVDDANTAVSKAESIRKFAILDSDCTEEGGHLTPSLKLKRNVVMRDFEDEVDALYGG